MKELKAIILAAGYGARLDWNIPKGLVKIGEEPGMNYLMRWVEETDDIDDITLATNKKYAGVFSEWLDELLKQQSFRKSIKLVIEPHSSPEEAPGQLGSLIYVAERVPSENYMILESDVFREEPVQSFIDFYKEKKAHTITVFDVGDLEEAKKFGIVTLDSEEKVIGFVEKPQNPPSTLANICPYMFPSRTLGQIESYLGLGRGRSYGHLIEWLYPREDIFGFFISSKVGHLTYVKDVEKIRNTLFGH